MTDIEKPKDKYWKVHKNDVGRELANPDYVEWADNKIEILITEVGRLRELVEAQRELAEHMVRGLKNFNYQSDFLKTADDYCKLWEKMKPKLGL